MQSLPDSQEAPSRLALVLQRNKLSSSRALLYPKEPMPAQPKAACAFSERPYSPQICSPHCLSCGPLQGAEHTNIKQFVWQPSRINKCLSKDGSAMLIYDIGKGGAIRLQHQVLFG